MALPGTYPYPDANIGPILVNILIHTLTLNRTRNSDPNPDPNSNPIPIYIQNGVIFGVLWSVL